jgi:acetyl/propionyl-CoA carboxylase alpha subunit
MINSLLIANRGEIAWPFIRTQILPGTGRCPLERAEGSHVQVSAVAESWAPSVASRHLPVPGRI